MKKVLILMLFIFLSLTSCSKTKTPVQHVHNFKKIVIEPKCYSDGLDCYICDGCGFVYYENYVRYKGHIYEEVTIEEENKKQIKCILCGNIFSEITINDSIELDYDLEYIWDGVNPKLLNFKDKETKDILYSFKLELDSTFYEEGTCMMKDRNYYHAKAKINEYTYYDTKVVEGNYGKHEYTDWVILKEATISNSGLRKRSCKICNRDFFEDFFYYEGV